MKDINKITYLQVVTGELHWTNLYTIKTRGWLYKFPIQYKWVRKVRNSMMEKGFIEILGQNKYCTITEKGREYLKSIIKKI